MPTALIRDLIAAHGGNEPETFQFLTEFEPEVSWFHQLFSVDLRALSLLRIFLGIVSILFVFLQFSDAEMLYSDQGILPRSLNQQWLGSGFWSVLWINGTFGFARTILCATGVVAFIFAFGYQTKIMNFLLLVLLWSIQVRNPLIMTGGDVLLRMLLFWSLFLPTHSIWSFDSSQMEKRPDSLKVASLASAGMILQIVFVYFFAGLSKLNPFWFSGDAIEYAMHLEMSVKPMGIWLSQYPSVMNLATYATLFAELSLPFLFFIPRLHHFNRGLLAGFFFFMHVGIWLTLSIGLFSLTAIVAWIVLIPSDLWNTFFGQPVGFSEKKFYRATSPLAERLSNLICGAFLILVVGQNVCSTLGPEWQRRTAIIELVSRATMTTQQFHMFSTPPLFSPWFEYNAQLDTGQRVDVFFPDRTDIVSKPESVYDYMQTQNWRRIHWNLITHPVYPPETELIYREIRRRLLSSVVKRWNAENGDNPVLTAELTCHLDPIRLERPDEQSVQFKHHADHKSIWARYRKPEPIASSSP
ncbi:MAG: HTTM domain-containing protein [Planctomycetota bacterium]